jgi:methyl-accepting chemotaxis protein
MKLLAIATTPWLEGEASMYGTGICGGCGAGWELIIDLHIYQWDNEHECAQKMRRTVEIPVSILSRFSIRWKLAALVSLAIVAFVAYGMASYRTIMTLRVNGDLYQQIVQGKDLIADILPPPEYIIESYLTVEQLASERDPAAAKVLKGRLAILEGQYNDRHEYWMKALPEGKLKFTMTDKAYKPAILFYATVKKDFLPALDAGNYPLAQEIASRSLTQYYGEHRSAIDDVVQMAGERCQNDEATAKSMTDRFIKGFAGFGAGVLIALLLLSFWIGQSIVKPLKKSILYVRSLASRENGHVGIDHLEVTSSDELGELFVEFNRFIDKIHDDIADCARAIVEATGKQSLLTEKMSNTILENDTQTNTGIEAVGILTSYTEDLNVASEKMTNSISTVATAAEEISTNINTVASTSVEISTTMISVASTAEQMSSNFTVVDGAMKELSSAITGVAQNAREGTTVANNASAVANETSQIMSKLGNSAYEIGKVTSVIKAIAKQTNLLALNAAIEAASAGDAGRGFAVVANEVKELAKQTATATEDISGRIQQIQGDTEKAVAAIQQISGIIGNINSLQKLISDMVEKQTFATTNISRNVSEASTGAGLIARQIAETANASKHVSHNINEIAQGANVVARNIASTAKTVAEVHERIDGTLTMVETTSEIMTCSRKAAITFTEDVSVMFATFGDVNAQIEKLNAVLKFKD